MCKSLKSFLLYDLTSWSGNFFGGFQSVLLYLSRAISSMFVWGFCLGGLFSVLHFGLYYILLIKLCVVVFTVDIGCL